MEETKSFWKTHRKLATALSIVAIVLSMLPYFVTFFQKGILLHDIFLKKTSDAAGMASLYVGKYAGEGLHVFVMRNAAGVARITYDVQGGAEQTYVVTVGAADATGSLPVTIADEQTGTAGEWAYRPDSLALFDASGVADFGNVFEEISISDGSGNLFENFKPNRVQMVEIVTGQADVFRGNFLLLFAALLLLGATFVSARLPLLLFTLRHMVDCENATPSEFYLTCQKIGQVVMPVLAGILFIASIFVR